MTTARNKSSLSLSTLAFIVALLGIGFAGFGFYDGLQNDNSRLLISWLLGFSFWFSISIGMLFLVMLGYIFGAGWSIVIRRHLEHAIGFFPWLGLLVAPLVLVGWFHSNPGLIWKWMNPEFILPSGETVGEDVLYAAKSSFLNLDAFTIRVAVYFIFFTLLSFALRRVSFSMDKDGDTKWVKKGRIWSAAGIPITAIFATFAVFDLFMSLSYHWFSTMYGVWFFATSMRAGLAVTIVLCYLLSTRGPLQNIYQRGHQYNLACLSLAFTVFWAYICFSQYFLIYNGNIPEETFWFTIREFGANWQDNSWWYVGAFGLVFGYFLFPFLYLLFYKNKVEPKRLLFIALWILTFHILDLYFNILPAQLPNADNLIGYTVREFSIIPQDLAMLIGVGALFTWSYLSSMRKRAIVPVRDPFINESLQYHE